MTFSNRLDDGESEAAAGVGGGITPAMESIEQVRQIVGGNANARILNPHFDAALILRQPDVDLAAAWRELDRVIQQVADGAPDLDFVRAHDNGRAWHSQIEG